MRLEEHLQRVGTFGFTERQTRFLLLVLRHSQFLLMSATLGNTAPIEERLADSAALLGNVVRLAGGGAMAGSAARE